MTNEERKEAERKKEAKRLEKLGSYELSESTEALPEEPAIKPRRTRRNK